MGRLRGGGGGGGINGDTSRSNYHSHNTVLQRSLLQNRHSTRCMYECGLGGTYRVHIDARTLGLGAKKMERVGFVLLGERGGWGWAR
jgi:hypothetical protein